MTAGIAAMNRRRSSPRGVLALGLLVLISGIARAQALEGDEARRAARFFVVATPLNDAVVESLVNSARAYIRSMAERRVEPVLIFEFPPSRTSTTRLGANMPMDRAAPTISAAATGSSPKVVRTKASSPSGTSAASSAH